MSNKNEDILQKLAPSIVEIISEDKEEGEENPSTLGTGFVVTDDGLVVTCRHVIADSQDKLMDSVKVRFHTDSKTNVKFTASSVKKEDGFKDDPSIDIAFLKLDKLPEKGVTPVRLDDKVVSLNHFASIGFKKAQEFTGLSAKGEIRMLTQIRNSKGDIISPEMIELHSPNNEIEPGMSGAPVLDLERNTVVGIITERYVEQYNSAANNMAFALPVKAMIELYPGLRENNQGLTLLSKFLREIGEESSQIYKWIDEVYVPPIEYDEIKAALKRDRIVFITGTREFGKTFTAIRLMYEFFKEGYNKNNRYAPKWVRGGKDSRREGADPRELMKLIDNENYIRSHEILYFEDPFGKTRYERSSELESSIRRIIKSVGKLQDAYVIITSREEVFKEFENEKLSSVELERFEKKMNLKRASYDTERRKEMLLRWAKVINCRWLLEPALREVVLKAIENQKLLPTPLNIKDFITDSDVIEDRNQLVVLMREDSEDTALRFGDEIIRMEEDEKVIFLTFPYVGNGALSVDFVKKMYEIIVANMKLSQKYPMDFDMVKKWFEVDKINISDNKIAFSHPSYHEAFQYAIDSEKRYNERINSNRIRDIFARVIMTLVYEDEAAWDVAYAITWNFDKLPPNIREQLLLKLAYNDAAAFDVAYAITENFNELPPNIQQLLFKLAENDKTPGGVAYAITENFNELPPNIQQLLFKLADEDSLVGILSSVVKYYGNNLPEDIRMELLAKLERKSPQV